MTALLTWTRWFRCNRCRMKCECFACDDGLRCKPCRPKDWQPPDAEKWNAQFRHLLLDTPHPRHGGVRSQPATP